MALRLMAGYKVKQILYNKDRMDTYNPGGKTKLSDEDLDKIRLYMIGKYDGEKFYYVDGEYVRNHCDMDFTIGGNYGRYAYIPKNELWVCDTIKDADTMATLLHEYIECRLMVNDGLTYGSAHEKASAYELYARRHNKINSFADLKKSIDMYNDGTLESVE